MSWQIMIHGGMPTSGHENHREVLHTILEEISSKLAEGMSALDAAELAVIRMEDNEIFNAGRGSALTQSGKVQNDAAIADGSRVKGVGAVAGVEHVQNPVSAARVVQDQTDYILFQGKDADNLARKQRLSMRGQSYFITDHMREAWKHRKNQPLSESGTVGAVVRDKYHNLVAATSTGGTPNKLDGRVSDSAIFGAGTFARNNTCALSATGRGEDIWYESLGVTASFACQQGVSAPKVARFVIAQTREIKDALAGVVVIDKDGNIGADFTCPDQYSDTLSMSYASATSERGVQIHI